MEDGDTEKYHGSSVIQNFVFSSRKRVVSDLFLGRYIISSYRNQSMSSYGNQ